MQTSDNHRIINGVLETEKVPVLPLRIRYYQSLISTDMLLKGMQYWQLRKSYVIFICTFDPFRQGLPMYRFSYRCRENLSLEMGDLTENIFLNATAADKATDKELAAFLSYVNGKAAESSFTKNLDNEVKGIDSQHFRSICLKRGRCFLFTNSGTKSPTEAGTDTEPSPQPATTQSFCSVLPAGRCVSGCSGRTGKCNTPPAGWPQP